MTNLLLVGDIHIADNPPSMRTDTYMEDILAKLSFATQKAAESDCDAIVLAGDVFHIKTPTRNSHRLVQRTGEVLTSAGIPVLIVPGNHDLSNDRLDSLGRQPLGTLTKMEGIELLIGPHPTLPIFGLPYLHDWVGELPKWMERYRMWCKEKNSEDFGFRPLMVTHAPIFPPGEDPPYEYIGGDDWARMMENGAVYSGHIHDPHGAYKVGGVWFCNMGAISRGSLHEKTLKRVPRVSIWDSERSNGSSRVSPQAFPEVSAGPSEAQLMQTATD